MTSDMPPGSPGAPESRLTRILENEYPKDDPDLARRIVTERSFQALAIITGSGFAPLLFPTWVMHAFDACVALPFGQLWGSQFKFRRLYKEVNGREVPRQKIFIPRGRTRLGRRFSLKRQQMAATFFPQEIRSLQLGAAEAFGAVESVKLAFLSTVTELSAGGAWGALSSWRTVTALLLALTLSKASLAMTQRGLKEIGILAPPRGYLPRTPPDFPQSQV